MDRDVKQSVDEISRQVLENFHLLPPMGQERILGLMQGMAIMRSLQDTQQNGGNQNGP